MTIPRIAALALTASLVASAAHAQWMGGNPYVALDGGWNHTGDLSLKGSAAGATGSTLSGSTTESEGYLIGGAAGIEWAPFRLELGLDYRSNDVHSIHVGSSGAFAPALAAGGSAGGGVDSLAGMVRGLMDLPWNFGGIVPYVGAGVGLVSLHLDSVSDAGRTLVNDRDTIPAIEGVAGLRYQINESWSAGLQYQFLNGFHPAFKDATGTGVSTNDYRNSSVVLRISYSFGAPPPPPPPVQPAAAPAPMAPAPEAAPAPGPRQLYLVFFDFNKSTITPAGQKVLDQAAVAFQSDHPVRIELTGYTDTVGTQQYNLGLSERRADAVRDYLAKKGLPKDRMDVAWKGKTDLRVQTPDGVREPQNRRVEIVIP
jgi:outer membrane protein OmpA-like peptidoglycan-associated protein